MRACLLASFALVASLALFALPAPAAAADCGTAHIEGIPSSAKVGDPLDITVFFDTAAGACQGTVAIDLSYTVGAQTYHFFRRDCPFSDAGDGIFCVTPNATTVQLRYKSTKFFVQPGDHYFGAQVLVAGTLDAATANVKVPVSGDANAAPPPTAAALPKPTEAALSVAIGNLTKTSDIAFYLASVYNYAIQVVVILAVAMTVWGGVKWLTAGGDQGRVSSAKETIRNAVTGLILALAALLILETIDPQIVRFKAIAVTPVARVVTSNQTWCEDIRDHDRNLRVASAALNCGAVSAVEPAVPGTQTDVTQCTWKGCTAPEGCAKGADGVLKCQTCTDIADDQLDKIAASVTNHGDADCAPFGAAVYNKSYVYQCVHTSDPGEDFSKKDKGCVAVQFNCAGVTSCADYDKAAIAYRDGSSLSVTKEVSCALNAASLCVQVQVAPHLGILCNAHDPCGVGPCTVRLTDTGTAWSASGFSLHIRVSRDPLATCVKS